MHSRGWAGYPSLPVKGPKGNTVPSLRVTQQELEKHYENERSLRILARLFH